MRSFCEDWKIQKSKIVGVVTDGGRNIKNAAKDEFGEDVHITCFAHKINNIADKLMELHKPRILPSEASQPPPEVPENESDADEDESDEVLPASVLPDTPLALTAVPPPATSSTAVPLAVLATPTAVPLADSMGPTARTVLLKVKKIVRFFRQSDVASSKLNAAQIARFQLKSDADCLKLVQEVRTRFSSVFAMAERYVKNR